MKTFTKKIFSAALALVMLIALSSAALAAPNSELGLWRDLKLDAAGVVHRVGHTPDGEPYIIFARQYYSVFPSVTRFSSNNTTKEHWLELTFPETKSFNKIDLYFFSNTAAGYEWSDYKISYNAGGKWMELVNVTGNTDMVRNHEFTAVTSDKVRVDILDAGRDDYARLNEIEILDAEGNNIAVSSAGTKIEADSNVKSDSVPTKAIDGHRYPRTAYWTHDPKAEGDQWLMVDFGEPKPFNEVKISEIDDASDGKDGGFVDYQLQYNAGTPENPKWVDLKKVTDNLRDSVSAMFETVTAQQVRLLITKLKEKDEPKIAGFRIYNRPSEENLTETATVTASSENSAIGCYADNAKYSANCQFIGCLTAYDFDGNILWQKGDPKATSATAGSDLPIQIYDIDHDGEEEILVNWKDKLQILSWDGTVEKEIPISINGDCIMPVNVRGLDKSSDILIKNRYKEVEVYTDDLEFLWSYRSEEIFYAEYYKWQPRSEIIGHFPYNYDLDGDGKDEIVVGNVALDDDGTVYDRYVFDPTEQMQHADGIKIGDFDPSTPSAEILNADSSAGVLAWDEDGNRLMTDLAVGHAQKMVSGDFVPTIPGIEAFTSTKVSSAPWPELYLHAGNGQRIWPGGYALQGQSGTVQLTTTSFVKAGSNQEYLIIPKLRVVMDGYSNHIADIPKKYTNRFAFSADLTGDEREELLFWNTSGIVQVWTNTADVPDGGKNIARNAKITVDSTDGEYSSAHLNDGDRKGAIWKSQDYIGDHWIKVDFGAPKTFDEIWLYNYCNREDTYFLDDFKIQYNAGSVSAPVWKDIHDVQDNMKKNAAFTFDAVTAQQVRILITDPTTALNNIDSSARLREIEIYEALPDNFAPIAATQSASGSETVIDLGGVKKIDGVKVELSDDVTNYKLQYHSGGKWTDIASIVCNTDNKKNFAFTPVEADAIRVVKVEGSGTVTKITAREWSGYEAHAVENEFIINSTKAMHRWTNY